jgi:hypothetical protein
MEMESVYNIPLVFLGFSALAVIASLFLIIKYLRPHRGKAVLARLPLLEDENNKI